MGGAPALKPYNQRMLHTVIARDGTDSEAPARRQAVREQHLAAIGKHVESGVLQYAGALLDEDGTMRGSLMIVDLPDQAAVRDWLADDVYSREGVWQEFEIFAFRRAV